MRLNNEPFESIKNGTKTIELRIYDEKRKKIKETDIIIFENRITQEIVKSKVIKLHKYNNFKEIYKHLDKVLLGYKENELADFNDMNKYYSIEDQQKYGVVGIEFELLNKNRKEIINNNDNLTIEQITKVVRRAKLLIETTQNEIILCHCNGNYFFLGGHVDNEESDMSCLHRELLEEAGVNIDFNDLDPFMTIKYFNKNYPEPGINTFTMANYYCIIHDLKPNFNNLKLTDNEKKGNFVLEKINKKNVIEVLNKSLDFASKKIVTLDTITILQEYLKIKSNINKY